MVTYIEQGHLYLNSKGIIIPSVSQLINFELGNEYKEVPPWILKKAADYGTKIHAMIQDFEADGNEMDLMPYEKAELDILWDYVRLKKQLGFCVNSMEQIIDYEERYAGRYDMLCIDESGAVMYDIKTTSKVMTEHLEIQLGLYYLALGIEKDYGYCLWLPKNDLVQRVKIKPWSNAKCIDLLERYERSKNG